MLTLGVLRPQPLLSSTQQHDVLMLLDGLVFQFVFRNTVLLLTITAVLNVAMWLWVVSMGITCIYGVYRAQDCGYDHARRCCVKQEVKKSQTMLPESVNGPDT